MSGNRTEVRCRQVIVRLSRLCCWLLCAMLFIVQISHAGNTTERFIWDQANTQMIHATEPDHYLAAAKTYQRLLKSDIHNPALLNNMGCALTLGGDYKNAQKAFENAERYSGTTPETTEGLTAAICRRDQVGSTELSWYRTAFFWHFKLPAHLRIITALAGWSLMWIGMLFYILRKRQIHRALNIFLPFSETFVITGTLIFLLSGASSLFSIYQEKQDKSYWQTAEFASVENMEEL